jgi:transposase
MAGASGRDPSQLLDVDVDQFAGMPALQGGSMAGIDIGVHRSDRRARVGKLTRQGSPQLRWALYEAALAACWPSSPDHADYLALKARGLSHTRASLTIARKLARRSFHVLRELGPAALEPVPSR